LDESAHIDGCNRVQIFFLLFRLVVPGLAAMAVLGFVIAWNEFIVSLTIISETAKKTYQLGLYDLMVNITTHYMRYGVFNGAAMLGLIPLLIAYMFSNRYFISGLTEGSVK
jgi:ABC-type maltose transport system permease subunit